VIGKEIQPQDLLAWQARANTGEGLQKTIRCFRKRLTHERELLK